MVIKKGDTVKVEYEGTLEDGTVFDSTEKHGEPICFEVGSGQLIPGFDSAIEGMKKGQKKEIKIKPEDAYGEHNPELLKQIPRDQLPEDEKLEVGMMLMLTLPNGMQFTAMVAELDDESVTIDLNHPLAGKKLNFKIKVIDVTPKKK
jgi:FKBP-type peptidyl-prolyl cis-trans isomerase 2